MTEIVRLDDAQITLVPGFQASGVACGIKKDGELDLALISADVPCAAAAVFTTNRVQAAPVLYDKSVIGAGNPVQAVVINSGCANACTGERGLGDVHRMAKWVGTALNVPPETVFVMSTGVIGQTLPMEEVAEGIASARQSLAVDGGHAAARAIMTTDTVPKEAAAQIHIDGKAVTIAGMCKGAGMIHPDMATMLAMLVTDASVEPGVLRAALKTVADRTFNMITVDGDTSTNDTLLVMANGHAGNQTLADTSSEGYDALVAGLRDVAETLAKSIVLDGEGATKFITIHVTGATHFAAAKQVAKSIAHSTLVKTAIYGQDANWGRVICAAGYSGIDLIPKHLSLRMENSIGSLHLVKDGAPFETDETRASVILAGNEIVLRLDLGMGPADATVWTCDLSHQYVDINAHYRT